MHYWCATLFPFSPSFSRVGSGFVRSWAVSTMCRGIIGDTKAVVLRLRCRMGGMGCSRGRNCTLRSSGMRSAWLIVPYFPRSCSSHSVFFIFHVVFPFDFLLFLLDQCGHATVASGITTMTWHACTLNTPQHSREKIPCQSEDHHRSLHRHVCARGN